MQTAIIAILSCLSIFINGNAADRRQNSDHGSTPDTGHTAPMAKVTLDIGRTRGSVLLYWSIGRPEQRNFLQSFTLSDSNRRLRVPKNGTYHVGSKIQVFMQDGNVTYMYHAIRVYPGTGGESRVIDESSMTLKQGDRRPSQLGPIPCVLYAGDEVETVVNSNRNVYLSPGTNIFFITYSGPTPDTSG